MNILQVLSLMSAAMPIVLNFEVLKAAKTVKARKAALKELTVQIMQIVDDLTPLRITDRKKFATHIAGLLDTLEFEKQPEG